MQKPLLLKFIGISVLMLLLLIPLMLIDGVVDERQSYRSEVKRDIARSWTGEQRLHGILIAAPYTQRVKETEYEYEDGKRKQVTRYKKRKRLKYFLPDTLNITGEVNTQLRARGIYSIPVYTANMAVKARVTLPKNFGIESELNDITWGTPYAILGVGDVRGINRSLAMRVDNKVADIVPGTRSSLFKEGVHIVLDASAEKEHVFDISVDLQLQGMETLSFTPIGKFTQVSIISPWQHPSFRGSFLPAERSIGEDGFSARWETSFFATNMQQLLDKGQNANQYHDFFTNSFGVALHQEVDIYQQVERSLKYALLFVVLTFVTFFLFEVLKNLRVHVVQYALVGISLALFYLLLVSLSEHIAFGLAYCIASAACVGILSFYVSAALGSGSRGCVFGLMLSALYGALYMLIGSQDFALLLGSGLIFAIVSFIMVITRHVDWYGIEPRMAKKTSDHDGVVSQ